MKALVFRCFYVARVTGRYYSRMQRQTSNGVIGRRWVMTSELRVFR